MIMGFTHQLDLPVLRVQEHGRTWKYSRVYTRSGLVSYSAPPEKNEVHKGNFWNEYIFLPIEYNTFRTDRENYFYGYRYLIVCPGITTVALPPVMLPNPISTVQLHFEVCRIRYFMEDDDEIDIVVDFMGDGMFPTRVTTIEAPSSKIIPIANDVCAQLVDQHCDWYSKRRI